jgi:hypothetical protein
MPGMSVLDEALSLLSYDSAQVRVLDGACSLLGQRCARWHLQLAGPVLRQACAVLCFLEGPASLMCTCNFAHSSLLPRSAQQSDLPVASMP